MRCRRPPVAVPSSVPPTCRAGSRASTTVNASGADQLVARYPAAAFQHPQRAGAADLGKMTGINCAAIDVVRRATTVAGIGKDVVDDERAAHLDPLGPALEILLGGGLTVSAVDEQ